MPEQEQKSFQRQTAYKVRISDILNAKLDDSDISRVNILATIVHKSDELSNYASSIIDDGTGRISLRSFENKYLFSKIDVGDVVLVIGKIREFKDERYVTPEILKKLGNFGWMNVRKLELNKSGMHMEEIKTKAKELEEDIGIYEEVYSTIKKLDKGDGVSIEEVIKNCNNQEAERMINDLLKKGNIFEIMPGRVKVLE